MSQPSNQSPEDVHIPAKSAPPAVPEPPAGHAPPIVHSGTPENATGHINPSSGEDANTTPGSTTVK